MNSVAEGIFKKKLSFFDQRAIMRLFSIQRPLAVLSLATLLQTRRERRQQHPAPWTDDAAWRSRCVLLPAARPPLIEIAA
jgi:hypothetical protein